MSNSPGIIRRIDANPQCRSAWRVTMRYFMSIIPPADLRPDEVPQGLMDAMGPWMEENLKAGALVSTGGLKPASEGRRLVGQTGEIVITDGPFSEAKEVIGGYAVFEAPDLRSATALAGA